MKGFSRVGDDENKRESFQIMRRKTDPETKNAIVLDIRSILNLEAERDAFC